MNFDKPPDPGAGEEQPTPSGKSTIPLSDFETPPERIGPYRILEVIGEGGMGTVYLAEQERPVRRKVALKIIKLGMDTKEVIGRFEAERQALAMMEHPNIATVYDAGTTETGRPYFVMEYIQGIPITDYCDQKRLSTRERLDLFIGVCKALHHAHQKAIIHRDVKPSNVLVTILDRKPVAKVIDFGVAKAINQRLTERTVYTEQGRLIGTPAYMSPEQADLTGLNVDTTTDVYSLGALLYELLTGSPSFDITKLREVGYEAIQKYIKEENPPKPSTRVSKLGEPATGVAEKRGTNMAGLVRQLRGELDWITMRAMEKDRIRRYPSASELAADVERYLQNEPIMARPPSARYYLRKMVARHKAPFAFAGVLFLVMAATSVVVGVLWQQSDRAHKRAEAGKLLAIGQLELENNPTAALAYATESLRISDQPEVRGFIMRALWRGPTMFRLPNLGLPNPLALDFSPDGNWLAVSWAQQGGLWLYPGDSGNGREPVELLGHDGMVLGARFFGSDRLLSSATDKTIRLWSVPRGELLQTWEFESSWVTGHLSRDGDRLFTCTYEAGQSPTFRSWKLDGTGPVLLGKIGPAVKNVMEEAGSSQISPHDDQIAYFDGRDVFLVPPDSIGSGSPVLVGSHEHDVLSVAFDHEGAHLASIDRKGGIRVWIRRGTDWVLRRSLESAPGLSYPRFDRSASFLVNENIESMVPIWDLTGPVGAEALELRASLLSVFWATFHPSGRWLVSSSDLAVLAAWPLSRPYPIVLDGVGGATFTPDGKWLRTVATVDDGYAVYVRPTEGGIGDSVRCIFQEPRSNPLGHAVSPDGRSLAVASDNGEVRIVPIAGEDQPTTLTGFTWVGSPTFSPDGRSLAAAGSPQFGEGFIKVWHLDSGKEQVLDTKDELIRLFQFTADNSLYSISGGSLYRWNLEDETYEVLLEGVAGFATMTPDSRFLLYLSRIISPTPGVEDTPWYGVLYDVERAESRRIPIPDGVIRAALNEAGTLAAFGTLEGDVHVMSLDDLEPHLLLGHEDAILGLSIDPKGRWIASSDRAGVTRLWPIPQGRPFHSLPHDELMTRLLSLTNIRAVPDEESGTGYRIEAEEFPGWEPVPSW